MKPTPEISRNSSVANGKVRHFLKLSDISADELREILALALKLKKQRSNRTTLPPSTLLSGKVLGLLFEKASTRTRVSFEVGIRELGGDSIFLSEQNIQTGRGETLQDTLLVLERYLGGIVVRNHDHRALVDASKYLHIPVFNGLSEQHHPCQAIADALTILEELWGSVVTPKSSPTLAYVGEGNNVMVSLIELCSMMKWPLRIATPKKYRGTKLLKDIIFDETYISFGEDPIQAVKNAQVVYTDTWFSMPATEKKGQTKSNVKNLTFKKFQINKRLLSHADSRYIFMHCLPAYRGQEVTKEVLEGHHSVVFNQAENRLHAQKALLQYWYQN